MDKVKAPKKKKQAVVAEQKWPKITVGSHLTVTEFEDGQTILAWDDEALQRECEEAIASVSTK